MNRDAYGQPIETGSVVAWGSHTHSGTTRLGVVRSSTPRGIRVESNLGWGRQMTTLMSQKNVVVTRLTEEELWSLERVDTSEW